MFIHNKRLQYTVRVSEPNPKLACMLLEQFGGADGELAAAMRYFTQGLGEEDPGRKDMLMDIATEELSHLEVIGSIVAMLNRGAKAQLAEAQQEETELYRMIGAGGTSVKESILFGGGPALIDSAGVPSVARMVQVDSAEPPPPPPPPPPASSADLSLTKRGERINSNAVWTLEAHNAGPGSAQSVVVTDTLPP